MFKKMGWSIIVTPLFCNVLYFENWLNYTIKVAPDIHYLYWADNSYIIEYLLKYNKNSRFVIISNIIYRIL